MERQDWYRSPGRAGLGWVAAQAGAGWRATGSARLTGGIASAVDAVTLAGPGGATERLVLKRWLRPGWQDEDPESTPAREAAVLTALAGTDVPAPQPVAVDPDGRHAGAPALLMTHIDGRRPSQTEEARPARIAAMAEVLVRVHSLDGPIREAVDSFRPYYEHSWLRGPSASDRPALWRTAIAFTAREPAPVGPAFLHRDFHPANTVWRGSRLVGVVDWASAAVGPVAVDLAHWRANLGTRHGIEVADRVLAAYASAGGVVPADQAWWDVRLLLDFLDAPGDLHGGELERWEAYLEALLRRV